MKRLTLIAALIALFAGSTLAMAGGTEETITARFKAIYPDEKIAVQPAPVAGLYEVVVGKATLFYVDAKAEKVINGHIFDIDSKRDLTKARLDELSRIDVGKLPLKNALKIVKGNGKRKLYVFSDPDCPFCKRLEQSLDQVDNVTIYTFLYPLTSIHPQAKAHAVAIWCASNRKKAWHDWMLEGKTPKPGKCKNPVDANIALGESLDVNGTPTLFNAQGIKRAGAMRATELDHWLVE